MENLIQVSNLVTGYEKNNVILQNINLSINKGDFIGIIGKNGAGKSTLLKTLRGFLPYSSGSVELMGKALTDYQQRELAMKIAYLQQQVELTFDYTAKDIVMAGRYPYKKWYQQQDDRDKAVIEASMEYTGVSDLADKPIRALSGGQRQRVLLAKVLAQQTEILFLDEPAAGLDLFYQEEIFRFCQELCRRGKTVVMVVHELNLAARYCSRLVLLKQGEILADGIPEEVLQDEILSNAYDAPIRAVTNEATGHADIFTEPSEDSLEKQQLLDTLMGKSVDDTAGEEHQENTNKQEGKH